METRARLEPSYLCVLDKVPKAASSSRAELGLQRWRDAAAKFERPNIIERIEWHISNSESRLILEAIFGNSPFLTLCATGDPGVLLRILQEGPDIVHKECLTSLRSDQIVSEDLSITAKSLRTVKRRASLTIAVADITGQWETLNVTRAISDLADISISYALRSLLLRFQRSGAFELPNTDDPSIDSGYIVLGMGKLGARELNYSSDIDLIILYDQEVIQTKNPTKLQQLLVRLTRELVKLLSERTEDGYVFRTDLRLRPDPSSTPLALSVSAAETYYEGLGQNWERAAMIKARQVAGDQRAGTAFLERLSPFIWRKNLDFAAIQDIHSIKRQINAYHKNDVIALEGHNVKLGRGGIREIEFFTQTQQLIWGGRHSNLRSTTTQEALLQLAASGIIGKQTAKELINAYWYLRKVEHRLQMIDDQQTHSIPEDQEGINGIAKFLGHENSQEFRNILLENLNCVETNYRQLFEEAPSLGAVGKIKGNLIFTGSDDDPETLTTLTNLGFHEPSTIAEIIRNWHRGRYRATRTERARQILTELVPRILLAFAPSPDPDGAFHRFDSFLSKLPAGIQLFSMFRANSPLLELMAEVMGSAPRIANHLSRRPSLMDFILDPEFYGNLPPADRMLEELNASLKQANNYEEVLNICRVWAGDRMLQIGIQALRHLTDWEVLSRAISDVATTVITTLSVAVEKQFVRRHGVVPGGRWMVLAMGKLGGREMTPASDLDLIIIYDNDVEAEQSNGKIPLTPSQYYSRLTQRLINALTVQTAEGKLFNVDMRLRPSGTAGPIASHINAFAEYHEKSSWTWEHMALLRSRAICGPDDLIKSVTDVVKKTLICPRNPDHLRKDVVQMRTRIDDKYHTASIWEIKHHRGGLIDIEFIVQYLQLLHAHNNPKILAANTVSALTNLIKYRFINAKDGVKLKNTFALFQTVQGMLRLTLERTEDNPSVEVLPAPLQQALARSTKLGNLDQMEISLRTSAADVFGIYNRIIAKPGKC